MSQTKNKTGQLCYKLQLFSIVATKCNSLGTFRNGKITYDRSPSNGKYPVSTIAYYSCNLGFSQMEDNLGQQFVWNQDLGVPQEKPKNAQLILVNITNYSNL